MSEPVTTIDRRRTARVVLQAAAAMLVAVLAVALPSTSPLGAAPPTTDGTTAAGLGAGWLAGQIDDGIPIQNFGSGDWGATLDAALALVAANVGSAQVDAVWAAMVADRDTVADPFSSGDQPGRLARMILLATAIGEDPTAVGTGPGADLVTRLEALEQTSGADTGLFGTDSPTYDGAYRQGYALAALRGAGVTTDAAATDWLVDQQCADGSWMPYRSNLATPCAFDAVNFVGPDSNSTAAALTGLAAQAPASAAIAGGVTWLTTVQNTDGGWGLFPGDVSEPSSIALVWQSLIATGTSGDARFASKSATPLQALLTFQLGCTSPEADRGAFTYPGSNDAPNAFSTGQAVPGAAGVAFPLAPSTPTAAVPVVDCSVPTTTTTTTTTPSTPTTAATVTTTIAPSGAVRASGAARPLTFAG
ncbi:hypothetical protein BH10ACT3_BH10ACT3_03350 [soil metagenome]